jgi:hypothetical protein
MTLRQRRERCRESDRVKEWGQEIRRGVTDGWRHVEVTDHRTAVDFAHPLKDLSDTHFPNARKITLVQDNLNIHTVASLYQAFPAAEARRLVERFDCHHTPKHCS